MKYLIVLSVIALALAGCGGDGGGSQLSQAQARASQAERSAGTWQGLAIALLIGGVVVGILLGSKARRDGS